MDVMKAVESLQGDLWGVWFLIGAALVFWMQEIGRASCRERV